MASVDWIQEIAGLYFTFTPDEFENLITDRKDPQGNGSAIMAFVGKAAVRGTTLFLYVKETDKQVRSAVATLPARVSPPSVPSLPPTLSLPLHVWCCEYMRRAPCSSPLPGPRGACHHP